jgi:tetratricopeptide (TPR) repeat protein
MPEEEKHEGAQAMPEEEKHEGARGDMQPPWGKCFGCQKKAHNMKHCSKCKLAVYCSVKCQHGDWSSHKLDCKQWRKSEEGPQSSLKPKLVMLTRAQGAKHAISLGDILEDNGNHGDAISSYEKAVKLNPKDVEALFKLGGALAATNRLNEAIKCCKKAMRIQPGCCGAKFVLADIHSSQGNHRAAEEIYTSMLELKPSSVWTWRACTKLGICLSYQGDNKGAMELYRKVIGAPEADPSLKVIALTLLALALADQSKIDEGIDLLKAALSIDPTVSSVHCNLGGLLTMKGDDEAALAAYRKALAINPKYGIAAAGIASCLSKQGDAVGALKYDQKALALDSQVLQKAKEGGYRQGPQRQGLLLGTIPADEMETKAREFVRENGNKKVFTEVQSLLHMATNMPAGRSKKQLLLCAETITRAALEEAPNSIEGLHRLAMILKEAGDKEGCAASFRKAVEIDPQCSSSLHCLAAALGEFGEWEEVASLSQAAIDLDGGNCGAYMNLAMSHLCRKDYSSAASAFRAALTLDADDSLHTLSHSEHTVIHHNLSVCMAHLGHTTRPMSEYEYDSADEEDDVESYENDDGNALGLETMKARVAKMQSMQKAGEDGLCVPKTVVVSLSSMYTTPMLVSNVVEETATWVEARRQFPIHLGSRSLGYDQAMRDGGPAHGLWELALKLREGYNEAKQALHAGVLITIAPFLSATFGGGWNKITVSGQTLLEKKLLESEWSPKRQQIIASSKAAQEYLDATSPGISLSIDAAWFIQATAQAANACSVLHELCRYRSGCRAVAAESAGVLQAVLNMPTMRILYSSMLIISRKENWLSKGANILHSIYNSSYRLHIC